MSDTIIVEKAELLAKMRAGYAQFEALLASLDKEQMTQASVNGSWSVKDNLAHISAWQDYLSDQLQGVLTGQKPPALVPGITSEEEENEHLYQEYKDQPLEEVLANFRASYQRALQAVQALSQESLNAPFPWSEDNRPIWPFIVGNTFEHYEEHGETIKRWLEKRTA